MGCFPALWALFALCIAQSINNVVAAETVNLTVYRVTPRNYTGVAGFDTGDAAGDVFFGLYEKIAPVVCSDKTQMHRNNLCLNQPILQIPGFNVYIQTTIEVDARFGSYSRCNPDPDTGVFQCDSYSRYERSCWYSDKAHPEWLEEFGSLCNRSECYCKAVYGMAVGRESTNHYGQPSDCPSFETRSDMTLKSAGYRSVETNQQGCCTACMADNKQSLNCKAFSHDGKTTCTLHSSASYWNLEESPHGKVGFHLSNDTASVLVAAAHLFAYQMSGYWYSTQEAGECKAGQVVGTDCWWRVIEQKKMVNASCVDQNLVNIVEKRRPECFQSCPQPENRTESCWLRCFFETLTGNESATPKVRPTPREEVIKAFTDSFEDPSGGGCPEVPPCREPCLPACWAVPKGEPCQDEEDDVVVSV
mmetsp:Transcript_17758/g.41180  ORF Transcript_17758/g.41180 Transcript_17758/m.41180 type:complete len:418 (+) Transcript_17758:64-1317(+)